MDSQFQEGTLADDVSVERNRSLNDLQAYYDKKKREIRDKGEADLQKVQAEYRDKVKAETELGEAAVNHIKANKKLQTDQIAANTNNSLAELRKNQDARIESQRQTQAEQQATLAKYRQAHQDEVEKQREVMSEQRAELRREATESQEGLKKEHAREIDDGRKRLVQQRENQKESLVKMRREHDELLSKELDHNKDRFRGIKQTYEKTLHKEKEESQRNVARIQSENQKRIADERNKGISQTEELRELQTGEIQKLEERGTKTFETQKTRHETTLAKQRESYEKQETEFKSEHQRRLENMQQAQDADYARRYEEYQSRKEKQAKDFQSQYQQGHQNNLQALDQQRDTLVRAAHAQKSELYQKIKHYEDKKQDPFYRIVDLDSKLTEQESSYVFSTRIPEHDRDKISVRVQRDKVLVTGQRAFQDNLKDEGKTIKTSSFQTIHEELKLDRPVREKEIAQSYKDGVLTVIIPKA